MRISTAVFGLALALGLCAMVLAAASLFRSDAPVPVPPSPVQQNVLPEVTAVAPNALAGSPAPATASSRELVRPTVTLRDQRISIQTAAKQVCAQAGMQYDFNRSKEKVGDKCRLLIAVDLENATLDEALAQIVLKNGLRYRMEGPSLWLEMPN